MNGIRRHVLDYGLAGLLLLVPLIILHANIKNPDSLNGFDRAVLRISSPLQAAIAWTVEGVGGVWGRYVWLVDVDEENQELRADNLRLRRELSTARRMAADTEVLEDLVGLKKRTAAETLGARVIATSASPYFKVARVRIDRGEREVRQWLPVVAADGLVGRVRRVFGSYADVLLTSDAESAIDVVIPRTGARGTLRGLGKPDSYSCRIEMLERGKEVKVGDEVVTSGLGGVFPAGIAVGAISAANTRDYSRYQEVEVTPAVDFGKLRSVVILLAPPPPVDPDADVEKRSPAAHSLRAF